MVGNPESPSPADHEDSRDSRDSKRPEVPPQYGPEGRPVVVMGPHGAMNQASGGLVLVRATPKPPETLGALIGALDLVENAYRSNVETARRLERLRGRPVKEYSWVDVFRKEDLDAVGRGPGVQEIRMLCELERLPLEASAIRQFRARLCVQANLAQEAADRLPLTEVAERLKGSFVPPRLPKLPFNIVDRQVLLADGSHVVFNLTDDQLDDTLHFLREIRARNGQWVSGPEIGKASENQSKTGVRWDRVVKRLPNSLRKHVESNRKLGYRLKLA